MHNAMISKMGIGNHGKKLHIDFFRLPGCTYIVGPIDGYSTSFSQKAITHMYSNAHVYVHVLVLVLYMSLKTLQS